MELLKDVPNVVTVEEAAAVLRVGRTTMYRLLSQGTIRHLKIGRKIVIPRAYLRDYIEKNSSAC